MGRKEFIIYAALYDDAFYIRILHQCYLKMFTVKLRSIYRRHKDYYRIQNFKCVQLEFRRTAILKNLVKVLPTLF